MSKTPNRLIQENSPYLLQHAYNAVDWFPWGQEAFESAKKEDKMIFLSIGYATCHWCHVMEKESFENEEIGALLNRDFICIKVDREVHPNIDQFYMNYAIRFSGSAGWPLSVFMTCEKQPFLIATYIPPHAVSGRKGMRELLPELVRVWKNDREKITGSIEVMNTELLNSEKNSEEAIHPEILEMADDSYRKNYDSRYGGFGDGRKFLSAQNLLYLIRRARETKNEHLSQMVADTLYAVRLSGTYDHIGFGIHRYSTDSRWHLPHYEKMLYDQAMAIMAYAEAWSLTGISLFRQTAEEIIEFLMRELRHSAGGFFSAYDADSEGEEGKYYVFDLAEIRSILNEKESDFVIRHFHFSPEGNFEEEATGIPVGKNLFSLGGLPEKSGIDFSKFFETWEPIRKKIEAVRETRVKPLLDDKILFEWNCMIVTALIKAGTLFSNPEFVDIAQKCLVFLNEKMMSENREAVRSFREYKLSGFGHLGDYARFVNANLEMYRATYDAHYLQSAFLCQEIIFQRFYRSDRQKFSLSDREKEEEIMRDLFEDYDGAYPSAGSINACNLLRLDLYFHRPDWKESAQNAAESFAESLNSYPIGYAQWLVALQILKYPGRQILIVSSADSTIAKEALEYARVNEKPGDVLLWKHEKNFEVLERLVAWTGEMPLVTEGIKIYVCENHACNLPVDTLADFQKQFGTY